MRHENHNEIILLISHNPRNPALMRYENETKQRGFAGFVSNYKCW